jgi:hypothetical protein
MYRDAAAGGGGVVDRDHAWHDFARQWQAPEENGTRASMESRDRGSCFGVATIPSQPPVEAAKAVERFWATRT